MTTPTREQVEALCADLDEHTEDERGYCDRCMFRWPCGAVETRDTLRALLADNERMREDKARLAGVLVNIIMHTAHLPGAPNDLLAGLLASVRRIADAALREGGA